MLVPIDIRTIVGGRAVKEIGRAASPSEPKQNVGVLDRLKEYKELIAVLVFFLGGFTWIYGYFATKSQLIEMKCVLNANVSLLSGQLQGNALAQSLIKNQEMQMLITKQPSPDIEAQKQLVQLQTVAKELERGVAKANEEAAAALVALRNSACHQ
jgi:hypothetical protein